MIEVCLSTFSYATADFIFDRLIDRYKTPVMLWSRKPAIIIEIRVFFFSAVDDISYMAKPSARSPKTKKSELTDTNKACV